MAEKVLLPMIPEPKLTRAERERMSELFADSAFWEWFEAQPEPLDEKPVALPHV